MKKIILRKFSKYFSETVSEGIRQSILPHDEPVAQKALMQHYRQLAVSGALIPTFQDAGFRKYSQFEEDGILLLIFSLIEPRTRSCVEICASDGKECCTANLIINHGWWGHLFDGDTTHVDRGRRYFQSNKDTFLYPPRFTQAWITAENVNELITNSGAPKDVDLLSLDMDGVDYWIWDAITCIDPLVVVCETHNPVPPDRAITVPYQPDFCAKDENFRSASLAAMTKLANRKGYRLVGTHRYGFNAFFIKNGHGEGYFPEVDVASCLQDPYTKASRAERWPRAENLAWHEV